MVPRQDDLLMLVHQNDYLISSKLGEALLILDCQGHLCAWPKRHGTQIGHRCFKDANQREISPDSAITISCGNGM